MGRRDFERLDPDEDGKQWRCWNCKRTFYVRKGEKPRFCIYCGASMQKGKATRLGEDPRVVAEL